MTVYEFSAGNVWGAAFINVCAIRVAGTDPDIITVMVPDFMLGVTVEVVDGELQICGRPSTNAGARSASGMTMQVAGLQSQTPAPINVHRSLWQRFMDLLHGRSAADYRVLMQVHPDVRLSHRNGI